MTTTVLLAGATGMLGNRISGYLLEQSDVDLRLLLRATTAGGTARTQTVDALAARGAQVVVGDVTDPASLDTDGKHILINSVVGYQKLRNVERDPRVAVAVSDPSSPTRYVTVRGRVTTTTTDGAADQIEALAQKYLGGPYPWYAGRDQTRATIVIAIEKIHAMGQ